MKIAIIGSNGQLGSDLMECFSQKNDVYGLTHQHIEVDDETSVRKVLFELEPEIVINTTAYHNVPICENNPEISYKVNAIGALNLAKVCTEIKSTLVHYSTDYVFDGLKGSPYVEEDNPHPLNIYAASKLAGESLVRNYAEKHYIIRISGIYGKIPCRAKGGNFISNIVKASKEKTEIKVVTDEILTPTPTTEIASNTELLVNSCSYGTYHMTCEGQCSWYEFTRAIFKELDIKTNLQPCKSTDFPIKVRRPMYTVLDNYNLKKSGINIMPYWEQALIKFLRNYQQ